MKYHIAVDPHAWTPRKIRDLQMEEQVRIQDFGDDFRLVVELRRTSPEDHNIQVHDARLEQRRPGLAERDGWQVARRVRRRDLILSDASQAVAG